MWIISLFTCLQGPNNTLFTGSPGGKYPSLQAYWVYNILVYMFTRWIISLFKGTPSGAPDCVDKPLGHNGGNKPQVCKHFSPTTSSGGILN